MSALPPFSKFFRILMVEDNPDDAFLILHTLRTSFPNAECTHAAGKAELIAALDANLRPDIVLSDWSLPQFNGLAALEMVRAREIDAPFIIVSGKIGEEAAINAIKQGVYDYVLKDNLARLPTAIQHALDYRENEKKAKIDNALIALQATALSVAPTAIAVLDTNGVVEWVNQAFEELTGYANKDVLGFSADKFCISPDFLPLESIRNDPAAQKEYSCNGMEGKKDGSLYIEERKICPVIDQDGTLSHIVLIKKDVTSIEQKRKELELDILFSNSLQQSKSPEGLCVNVISLMKEQFPEAKPTICLYTDGTAKIKKCFGEKLSEHEDNHEDTIESRAGLPPDRNRPNAEKYNTGAHGIRYEITMGEERIALFQVTCSCQSPLDHKKLFAQLAHQMESSLQRMIAQQKVSAQIKNISFLKLISRTINTAMDFETVVGSLLKQIMRFLDSDAVALYLNSGKETGELICRAQCGFNTNLIEQVHIKYGQPYVGIAAEEQRIISVSRFDDIDPQGLFATLIRAEGFVSQHCAPIIIAGKTTGVLEVFQRKPFTPRSEWLILFDAIASQTGLALDYNALYADLQKAYLDLELSYEATIEGWSSAMDFRDQETEGHSKRVASLAISLAARLGIAEEEIVRIGRGALLHDVGKIGIPDSILKKAGPLTDSEWVLMKQHPKIANEMLSRIPYLKESLDIPLYHHEKWDG
ncbi:MAG TPA: HD domain-containing phosphohydrolase, partial [Rectinemataceae bacterium]|nr:HD domain-containing phosphohydrolase [Rectinemataceae bacterium]